MELLQPYVENELKKRSRNRIEFESLDSQKELPIEHYQKHTHKMKNASSYKNLKLESLSSFFVLTPKTSKKVARITENNSECDNDDDDKMLESKMLRKKSAKNFFTKSLRNFKGSNGRMTRQMTTDGPEMRTKRESIDLHSPFLALNKTDAYKMKMIDKLQIDHEEEQRGCLMKKLDLDEANDDYISSEEEIEQQKSSVEGLTVINEAKHGGGGEKKRPNESMEDFKKAFAQNQNLVVNWDYVQSSDYL